MPARRSYDDNDGDRAPDASGIQARYTGATRRAQSQGGKKGANSRIEKHGQNRRVNVNNIDHSVVSSDESDGEQTRGRGISEGKKLSNRYIEENSKYDNSNYDSEDDYVGEDDAGDFVVSKQEIRNARTGGRFRMGVSQQEIDAEAEDDRRAERQGRGGRIGGRVAGKRSQNAEEVRRQRRRYNDDE